MADYRSTLTGTQMDSALLDMAEHNSEAYAVGERNGIAVASDDVTYHNNARYYAQIASSQIVGDASSAVRWDTDQSEALTPAQKAVARNNIGAASDSDVVKITSQTLTSAEQAQARANIAAGGSNRNLLDNGWFTVRQRGDGPFTGTVYTFDRWRKQGATATVSYSNGFVSMTVTGFGWNHLQQRLPSELESALEGKTVTVSVLLPDGTVLSNTGTYPTTKSTAVFLTVPLSVSNATALVEVQRNASGNDTFGLSMNGSNGASASIKAFKLELGSVSTLANDAPPDYGKELAKCQRYFFRLKTSNYPCLFAIGRLVAPTQARITIPTPVSMRDNGTITETLNGNILVIDAQQNASAAITSVSASCVMSNGVTILANLGASLGGGHIATMETSSTSAYIDLSADL